MLLGNLTSRVVLSPTSASSCVGKDIMASSSSAATCRHPLKVSSTQLSHRVLLMRSLALHWLRGHASI